MYTSKTAATSGPIAPLPNTPQEARNPADDNPLAQCAQALQQAKNLAEMSKALTRSLNEPTNLVHDIQNLFSIKNQTIENLQKTVNTLEQKNHFLRSELNKCSNHQQHDLGEQ